MKTDPAPAPHVHAGDGKDAATIGEAGPASPIASGMTLDLFAGLAQEAASLPAASLGMASDPAPALVAVDMEAVTTDTSASPAVAIAASPNPAFNAVDTRPWPVSPALALRSNAGEAESGAERATIVFDLDGTLVHGDCGDRFMHWLLRRNPLRMLAALLVAPVAVPLLFLPAARRLGVSLFLWLATLGIDENKLAALAARFIADYRLRPIRTAVEALREEVSRGHRVVVATGALRALAEGLLRRLDIRDGVDIVASDIARFAGGWTVRWQCNGQVKLQRLRAEGFPGPYLRAYSDHYSDRWLLAAAGTPVLVNASAKHRQRLRAKFGGKLRVVLWQ